MNAAARHYSPADWLRYVLPAICLGAWGVFFIRLYQSHLLDTIQNPRFHGLTLLCGVLMVAAALIYPFVFNPHRGAGAGLTFRSMRPIAAALLWLSPVALYMLFPPRLQGTAPASYSTGAFERKNTEDGALQITVVDIASSSSSSDARKDLESRNVDVIGQYSVRADKPDVFELTRGLMICCAMDIRTYRVAIDYPAGGIKDGEWVRVKGRLVFEGEAHNPIITAEQVMRIAAPESPCVYP